MGTLNKPPILLDAYYTPDVLASFLVGLLPIQPYHLALEPSAGGGAFVSALLKKTDQVVALDLNPDAPALKMVGSAVCDFLDILTPNPPDWIIGNPPCKKVFVLSERPSFTGGATDSSAYGFFWWDVMNNGPTELEVISWK